MPLTSLENHGTGIHAGLKKVCLHQAVITKNCIKSVGNKVWKGYNIGNQHKEDQVLGELAFWYLNFFGI